MRILPDLAKYKRMGIISVCALSVMILSGCGRKVFPRPQGAAPPPRVTDLSSQIMPGAVELSWSPVTRTAGLISYGIMKYELEWKKRNCLECPAPGQRMVQSISVAAAKPGPDGKLRWVDKNVSYYRVFRYQIALIDDKGNSVSFSNPVIAKVYPGPAAPVDITAATQRHGILIRWKPVLKNLEGKKLNSADLSFRVERLSGEKGWEKASPVLVKGDAYYDQAVAPRQSYSYRVVPFLFIDGIYVQGEPSATVQTKGPQSVSPPPPGKVWITPGHGALEIHWTESSVNAAGYQVYRRQGKEIVRLTASPVKHPPFVDSSARKGATYFYAVSTVSALPGHKEGLLSKWVKVRNLLGK